MDPIMGARPTMQTIEGQRHVQLFPEEWPNAQKYWPTLKTFGQTDKTLCESGQKILAKMKNILAEHSKILAKQSKILAKNFIKFKSVYNFWERQFARSR